MKQIILVAVVLLANLIGTAQVIREGKTFKMEQTAKSSAVQATEYKWQEKNGEEYPIYISKTGSCYIVRTSKKTGKQYRKYLPKEISATIAKEFEIEYKSKNNNH